MKRSVLLGIALALSLVYLAYSVFYWVGGTAGSSGAEAAGFAIASALVMPHLVCVLVGTVFTCLGFFMAKRAFALVAGILYAVAMLLFPMYFFFVIIQTILCFVAFARMKPSQQTPA